MNYYNEFDPKAAAWLEELIKEGHIPNGKVDRRSIRDVRAEDLKDFTQCHFFAGIGGWSCALRLAGWPEDRPVWTGSCPCQPFSCAGKGLAESDERHLWPVFRELIRACQPPVVFGEQVASKLGRDWLAGVFADLEAMAYSRAGADLCAAGVGQACQQGKESGRYLRHLIAIDHPATRGRKIEILDAARELEGLISSAPHIRQRLFWAANAQNPNGRGGIDRAETGAWANGERGRGLAGDGVVGGMADPQSGGFGINGSAPRHTGHTHQREQDVRLEHPELHGHNHAEEGLEQDGPKGALGSDHEHGQAIGASPDECGGLGNAECGGRVEGNGSESQQMPASGLSQGFWGDAIWHPCRDGKARRISPEPAFFPLAHGIPGRVGLLRGYGNAIVPQVAAEFITAFMEAERLL